MSFNKKIIAGIAAVATLAAVAPAAAMAEGGAPATQTTVSTPAAKKVTVKFVIRDKVASDIVEEGSDLSLSASAAAKNAPEGYEVTGWTNTATGENFTKNLDGVKAAEGLSFKAILNPVSTPEVKKVTVKFVIRDKVASDIVEEGSDLSLSASAAAKNAPEGYEVTGWTDANGNEYPADLTGVKATEGLAFTAVLTKIAAPTVKVALSVGNIDMTFDVEEGASLADAAAAAAKNVQEGYEITGWTNTATGENFSKSLDEVKAAEGLSFKAVLNKVVTPEPAKTVKVAVTVGDVDMTFDVEEGASLADVAADAAKNAQEGYEVTGWTDANGNEYPADLSGITAADGLAFTAVLNKIANTVDVAFTVGNIDMTFKVKEGDSLTQAAGDAAKNAQEGYKVVGWTDAAGNKYAADLEGVTAAEGLAFTAELSQTKSDDTKKDDTKPADTAKKDDTKSNPVKKAAQAVKKAALSNTGATVGGVAVFAVIALLGFAGITVLRKRA